MNTPIIWAFQSESQAVNSIHVALREGSNYSDEYCMKKARKVFDIIQMRMQNTHINIQDNGANDGTPTKAAE